MKDYKRLTNPNLKEYYPKHDFCLGCKHFENHDCNRRNGTCAQYEDFNEFYDRLFDLENKIESGEIDYVANSKTRQTITDLLIEFDEMGFAPTTVCSNSEQYATEWRERVRKEFTRLTEENENLTRTLDKANDEIKTMETKNPKMTEEEMIQKIYEVIKLVDCMQYNPSVDFNYLRAKGAYNIIKNQIEHIKVENEQLKQTLSKKETVEKELRERLEKAIELPTIYEHTIYPFIENSYTETIYYVVYKENGRIISINYGKNKQHAEARLAELKGR